MGLLPYCVHGVKRGGAIACGWWGRSGVAAIAGYRDCCEHYTDGIKNTIATLEQGQHPKPAAVA